MPGLFGDASWLPAKLLLMRGGGRCGYASPSVALPAPPPPPGGVLGPCTLPELLLPLL